MGATEKKLAAKHGMTEGERDVLVKAGAQAARYQTRIDEQSRLLGLQGKRITGALAALGDGVSTREEVAAWLTGAHDDD